MGFGLMLELERRGFPVRAGAEYAVNVRPHRVAGPDDVDAVIHLASGIQAVERAEEHAGAQRLAFADPRSADDIERFERLRADVVASLRERGLDDLVPLVDDNLFVQGNDERLPVDLRPAVDRLWSIPQPVAVYTWDPTA
jgi:hypothetical protein